MAKNKNLQKYPGRLSSVGTRISIVFCILVLVYVLYHIFFYSDAASTVEYEVQEGRIASAQVYKGLILREETVFYAPQEGVIRYYAPSASKVSAGGTVYSLDTSGTLSEQMQTALWDTSVLTTEEKKAVSDTVRDFSVSYDGTHFSSVYTFKNSLNSDISQILSSAVLDQISADASSVGSSLELISAGVPGLVLYYTDGYEGLTAEEFSAADLDASSYQKETYASGRTVGKGDAAFKLVTDEDWSILIAISDELAEELSDASSVSVIFCKDGYTADAGATIWKKEGGYYLQLSFSTAMIRYASERFIELELNIDTQEGLKIPNSAITQKEFFTIPNDYFMQGGDSNENGLLVQKIREDGEGYEAEEFITPTIYYQTEDFSYVDEEELHSKDLLIQSDSPNRYVVGTDVDTLTGVYNINKGYAVFKQIQILHQNEEYAIVAAKTSYGLSLYDHIALDGSLVQEGDFTQ